MVGRMKGLQMLFLNRWNVIGKKIEAAFYKSVMDSQDVIRIDEVHYNICTGMFFLKIELKDQIINNFSDL